MGQEARPKPQHKQKHRREKSLRCFWSRRRDYLRLYGHEERQGFYERLDSFASAARAAPSCVTAAGCFRKRPSLARGGRMNRQPRIKRRISKRFGGCGSNLSQQQRPRDGRNAISGSWSRRRDLRLWRRAPVNSPPGCSVCAQLCYKTTIHAQTARSRSRLHPQIPLISGITKTEDGP